MSPIPRPIRLNRQIVRQQRRRMDLSREELARRLGVSAASVRAWENGERNPSLGVTERIAELLQLDLAELAPELVGADADLSAVRRRLGISAKAMAQRLTEAHAGQIPGLRLGERDIQRVESGQRLPFGDPAVWAASYHLTVGQFRDAWLRAANAFDAR